MKLESKRPIAVEDLLRLKRAERPAPEFWNEFERELRAKQLAALVAKRPWWQRMPRVFGVFSRYPLPIGAAAVLAITFVSVQKFESSPTAPSVTPTAEPTIATENVMAAAPVESSPAVSVATPVQEIAAPAALADAVPAVAHAAIALTSEATKPGDLSRMVSLLGASEPDVAAESSPSARYIAENLAAVQSPEPVIGRGLLGATHGLDARAYSTRGMTVEPLQQMAPPSETRRSRLLTAMVTMTSLDTSVRAIERAASQIPEERLYDRVRRIGAQGDRLHVRF